MKRFQLAKYLIPALAATVFHGAASAAETLPASLRSCMSEPDDSRRLSCYDRESARLTERGDAQAKADIAAPAAAPAASAEEKFGYRGSIARTEFDKQQEQERKFQQLTAKIVELDVRPHGELVLTLDNGQVWAQKTPDRSIRPKVGEEVTIRRAALGSFLLSTASKKSTRVTRVQ